MKDTIRPGIEALIRETDFEERIRVGADQVFKELRRAMRWPPMNSAHEGYAVLAEEVDELWDHVKVQQGKRDVVEMTYEAVQVAAMALRFIVDVGRPEVVAK
jgi:hypothetical protein